MRGSVILSAYLKYRMEIRINHVVLEGSSQWVIGRNVTAKCDITQPKGNFLILPNSLEIPIGSVCSSIRYSVEHQLDSAMNSLESHWI